MNRQKLTETIRSIYDWPLDDDKTWEVYNNFLNLLLSEDVDTKDFLMGITKFDKGQRLSYRNRLSEMGYELRPDELAQYIVLIIIAFNEVAEVKNG